LIVSVIASLSLSISIIGTFRVYAYPFVIQDRLLVKFCVVKNVKTGVLEQWSNGVLVKPAQEMVQIPSSNLPITPSLQISSTPATKWHAEFDKDLRINQS
jgi:hypothetical protein